MIKSKFSFWVISTTFVFLILSSIDYLIFKRLISSNDNDMPIGVLIFIILLLFTWVWLFFGELRTKIIIVEIDDNLITVRNFLGFGRKRKFEFSECDGYTIALLPSKYRAYEYLYLLKNGKKEIKISEFYHQNYSQLKIELAKKVKFIGKEKFSYLREFRELFK